MSADISTTIIEVCVKDFGRVLIYSGGVKNADEYLYTWSKMAEADIAFGYSRDDQRFKCIKNRFEYPNGPLAAQALFLALGPNINHLSGDVYCFANDRQAFLTILKHGL